jgi:hypothetical protein
MACVFFFAKIEIAIAAFVRSVTMSYSLKIQLSDGRCYKKKRLFSMYILRRKGIGNRSKQ